MFENLRRSLNDLLDSHAPAADPAASLGRMRSTLVQARVGLGELREGVETSRVALDAKQRELETVQRRKAQAAAIGDQETVQVAERYEALLSERVQVLEQKLAVQEAELALAEREVAEMTQELRRAIGGASVPRSPAPGTGDPLADPEREALDAELANLERTRMRGARDADAESHLAELKRRMGK